MHLNLEFPALKVVSHNYIVLHVYAIFQVPLYYTYNRVIAKTEFEVIRTSLPELFDDDLYLVRSCHLQNVNTACG